MSFIWNLGQIIDPVFKLIFGFVLNLPDYMGVFFLALLATLITSFAYKYFTDQELMRKIKEELKEIQKKLKNLSATDPEAEKLRKEMMQKSMLQMKQQFKPKLMLFTTLPILFVFGWLSLHYSYEPLAPNQWFEVSIDLNNNVNGVVSLDLPQNFESKDSLKKESNESNQTLSWLIKGPIGNYLLDFKVNDKIYSKKIIISDKKEYANPIKIIKDDFVKKIEVKQKSNKILGMNWLLAYILFSIVLSISIRKILKIH